MSELTPSVKKETEQFDPSSVAIILITRYPQWYLGRPTSTLDTDKIRGDEALETIRSARKKGYQTIVAGSKDSSLEFSQSMQMSRATVVERPQPDRTSGFLAGILEATRQQNQIKGAVLMQPEKSSLVASMKQIAQPLLADEADVVVPKRHDRSFRETYPGYMEKLETDDNAYANRLLQIAGLLTENDLDVFFGVVAYRNAPEVREKIFALYQNIGEGEEIRQHMIEGVIFSALAGGLRVASVEVPFKYPEVQRQNEEANETIFLPKRRSQRHSIVRELVRLVRQHCQKVRAQL